MNNSAKRLFIAIPLSQEFQKEILHFQSRYRSLPVRFLSGHNLHITLIPPWYEEDTEKIKVLLQNFENYPSFDLEFKKIIFGPNLASPRMIWACGEAPATIINLKKDLENLLLKNKIIPAIESRPFRLHVTVARFRPQDFSRFTQKNLQENFSFHEKISSLVLMESELTETHAEYKILHTINLKK